MDAAESNDEPFVQPIVSSDLSDITRDIDSYAIVSKSLCGFTVDDVCKFDLRNEQCRRVQNVKLFNKLKVACKIPQNLATLKAAREFKLFGEGQFQVYCLLLYPTKNNFIKDISEKLSSTEDRDVDSEFDSSDDEDVINVSQSLNQNNDNGRLTTISAIENEEIQSVLESYVKGFKAFFYSKIFLPALSCLDRHCKSRLRNVLPRNFDDVETFNHIIKIYKNDFPCLATAIDNKIKQLTQEKVLGENQILFYRAVNGILSSPFDAKEKIMMLVDEEEISEHLILIQVHCGITFHTSLKCGMFFKFSQLDKLIDTKVAEKTWSKALKRYRNFNLFHYGFFAAQAKFKDHCSFQSPGNVSFVQGYDPAIHKVRNFKRGMSFCTYAFLQKLKNVKDGFAKLKAIKNKTDDAFHAYADYLNYLKEGNSLRIEFVLNLTNIGDLFCMTYLNEEDRRMVNTLTPLEDHQFLRPLIKHVLQNNLIYKFKEPNWHNHIEETGCTYFNLMIQNLEQCDFLNKNCLMKTFCYELLMKYFTFGTTEGLDYDIFKILTLRGTELKSVDGLIIRFNDVESIDLDLIQNKIFSKIGKRDFFHFIPVMKSYLEIIAQEIENFTWEKFNNEVDLDAENLDLTVQILMFKIALLIRCYGQHTRQHYGLGLNLTSTTSSFNVFKRKSLINLKQYLTRTRQTTVRMVIEGQVDIKKVYEAMKKPKTLFGLLCICAIFSEEELEDKKFSKLFFRYVQNNVEVFPNAVLYNTSKQQFTTKNQILYKWSNVVDLSERKMINKATNTKTEIGDPESTTFTKQDLREIFKNLEKFTENIVERAFLKSKSIFDEQIFKMGKTSEHKDDKTTNSNETEETQEEENNESDQPEQHEEEEEESLPIEAIIDLPSKKKRLEKVNANQSIVTIDVVPDISSVLSAVEVSDGDDIPIQPLSTSQKRLKRKKVTFASDVPPSKIVKTLVPKITNVYDFISYRRTKLSQSYPEPSTVQTDRPALKPPENTSTISSDIDQPSTSSSGRVFELESKEKPVQKTKRNPHTYNRDEEKVITIFGFEHLDRAGGTVVWNDLLRIFQKQNLFVDITAQGLRHKFRKLAENREIEKFLSKAEAEQVYKKCGIKK